MTTLRIPLVAGLEPSVGTSTLAAALHALDAGPFRGVADIVVCGSSGASLRHADAVTGVGLVLALALPPGAAGPPRARLRALADGFDDVVLVPHVPVWHGLASPLEEGAALLGQPPEYLPRPLRAYAAALRLLAAAVVRSGRLDRSTPPPAVPPAGQSRGPRPVEQPIAPRPVLIAAPRVVCPAPINPRSSRPVRVLAAGRFPFGSPPPGPSEPDDDTLEAIALALPATTSPDTTGRDTAAAAAAVAGRAG